MRPRLLSGTPFRPAAIAHYRNSHSEGGDADADSTTKPRLGLAILVTSLMLLVAAASMPLQLEVRARVAHAESRTLELTLDHPLSTDLMRTHARLGAAGGSCRVVPVVSDGSVSHSVRVTLVEPCALTVGAPATLTLETTFARLLLAHGAVRS